MQQPLALAQSNSRWDAALRLGGCLIAFGFAGVLLIAQDVAAHGEIAGQRKLEIIGIVTQAAITDFSSIEKAVCVVGWDEKAERHRVRGDSGKGHYLKAVTHGRW